jgi:hypothetical protein
VAAETWDGYLNDINGHHVTENSVVAALEAARSGPVVPLFGHQCPATRVTQLLARAGRPT